MKTEAVVIPWDCHVPKPRNRLDAVSTVNAEDFLLNMNVNYHYWKYSRFNSNMLFENLNEEVIIKNCDLVGFFGIVVQLILVILVFLAVKRRTCLIEWSITMKDPGEFSSCSLWTAQNSWCLMACFISWTSSSQSFKEKLKNTTNAACEASLTRYFMSLLIDVTIGLFITYWLVVLSNKLLSAAFNRVSGSLNAEIEKRKLFQRCQKKRNNILSHRLYCLAETNPGLAWTSALGKSSSHTDEDDSSYLPNWSKRLYCWFRRLCYGYVNPC